MENQEQPDSDESKGQWAFFKHLYDSLGKWAPVLLAVGGIFAAFWYVQKEKTDRQQQIETRLGSSLRRAGYFGAVCGS